MLALQSNVRSALPNKTCFSIASVAVWSPTRVSADPVRRLASPHQHHQEQQKQQQQQQQVPQLAKHAAQLGI